MGKLRMLLLAAMALPLALGPALPGTAADLGAGRPLLAAPASAAATADYLRRRAVLLMIRATFDLVADEEVPQLLAADLQRLEGNGPAEHELARLDRELLAEGSYYLVSLRYLAEVGGAVWPADRPESAYANDALVALEALQQRLIKAVNSRADPLPIFEQAQAILALSEGFVRVPADMDHFAGRDAIVAQLLASRRAANT
jgi:hypothetical protein